MTSIHQFRYCEKDTKFEKKSPTVFLNYSVTSKQSGRFFQTFVIFSEYLNFSYFFHIIQTDFKSRVFWQIVAEIDGFVDAPIAYCFTFCEYRYFFATLYTANDYDEQKHDNVIEACSRRRRRVLEIWVVKFPKCKIR